MEPLEGERFRRRGLAWPSPATYGATRRVVEDVAARHGWKVKTVLQKKSAQW